jgi:nitroreductase
MNAHDMTVDQVLSTTRAVRRRLDLERPVSAELIEECLRLAVQAPTSLNAQDWEFVVVSDPGLRQGLAEIYRRAVGDAETGSEQPDDGRSSDEYLAQHLQDVPVLVIPCIPDRTENAPVADQAARWGSILPATWSFMLAARARGLGTVWTTYHLDYERDAADLLGIPYDEYMQAGLIPVAYYTGRDFRPAQRKAVADVTHWNRW